MPRVSPDYVPTYRFHKATRQGIVTLSCRDHLLGPFGSPASLAKYHAMIARWLEGGRRPLDVAAPQPHPMFAQPPRLTVAQLINAHARHALTYYVNDQGEPTTEVANFEAATAPLRELLGPTPADDFSPSKLKMIRSRMITKGWARGVINRHVSRIRSVWSWGTEEELVNPTIIQALRAVKSLKRGRSDAKETEPIRAVPGAHVDAVMPFVSSPVWALIQLQRLSGARGDELFRLRAIDLDTTGAVWTHTPKTHKTAHFGHRRTLYFGPRAIAVLEQFISGRPIDAYLFSPREANAERKAAHATKAQPRRPGQLPTRTKTARRMAEHYTAGSYRRAIARACVLAKVAHWHPHQLRHNAATEWRKTYGPDVALTLLGDKSTRMIDVYAERDHQTAIRVVAAIG